MYHGRLRARSPPELTDSGMSLGHGAADCLPAAGCLFFKGSITVMGGFFGQRCTANPNLVLVKGIRLEPSTLRRV
jgi:hypothetical protein